MRRIDITFSEPEKITWDDIEAIVKMFLSVKPSQFEKMEKVLNSCPGILVYYINPPDGKDETIYAVHPRQISLFPRVIGPERTTGQDRE